MKGFRRLQGDACTSLAVSAIRKLSHSHGPIQQRLVQTLSQRGVRGEPQECSYSGLIWKVAVLKGDHYISRFPQHLPCTLMRLCRTHMRDKYIYRSNITENLIPSVVPRSIVPLDWRFQDVPSEESDDNQIDGQI